MNRTCLSNVSEYGYCPDTSLIQRHELTDSRSSLNDIPPDNPKVPDIAQLMNMRINGDMGYMNADAFSSMQDSLQFDGRSQKERGAQADLQAQLLLIGAQQIAQPRSFDECTCSSYSSDVPHCTCDCSTEPVQRRMFQSSLCTAGKQDWNSYQDAWYHELSDAEFNRLQKERFFQSLAVPDPSLEYPYYIGYPEETSIYDQEPLPPISITNNIPEKTPTFQSYQCVPKITESVPSPLSSPRPKPKSARPRLCHFLLELLANPQQYSEIVEWVDKDKGVFKFLNSSEVASQWGRRRNKPHMKYENFARSLRTYIAKGILTKPRSKLVYRFTSKVY